MDWAKLLAILGMTFIAWITYRSLKARPDLFTLDNFNKSFRTMLILAFVLVGFVGLCVILLKSS